MEVKILAFGIAKEIIGSPSIKWKLDEKHTAADLKAALEKDYEGLRKLSSFVLAINDEYAQPGDLVNEGDEIAIIPPVSGG